MVRELVLRTVQCPIFECRLSGSELVVGRSRACDVVLSHRSISRRHAHLQLKLQDAEVNVEDLASKNGTFIEGLQVGTGVVKAGQIVQFGDVAFELICASRNALNCDDEDTDGPNLEAVPGRVPIYRSLTQRQQEVLRLLVAGRSEKEIAVKLDVSRHTVHNHIRAVFKVLGVHSRGQLFAMHRSLWASSLPES